MTVIEVLAVCRSAGIRLEVAGSRLRFDARTGALTSELRDALARHKPEVLELLTSRFITLRDGPTLPLPVLQLAWRLEDRGFKLNLTVAGGVEISPELALTDQDRRAIARWRTHLAALTANVQRVPEKPT